MADYTIKTGDNGSDLVVILKEQGAVVDLTGATVKFNMRALNATTNTVDGASATVSDASAGEVTYTWVSGDIDVAGLYYGEFEVTFPDASIGTFPSDGYLEIVLVEDYG